jgi:hypothetical protein
MAALVDAGLVSGHNLYDSGPGQTDAEIRRVRERLERALRREHLAGRAKGRKEAVRDFRRGIEGKRVRYLRQTRAGRKVAGLLLLMRRALL